MRVSSKFPIAVQTVMIIAALSKEHKINSDILSENIGVNPVLIRNLFRSLKEGNLIQVSPGPGGVVLARSPEDISLWDIFSAVEAPEGDGLSFPQKQAKDHCPIGNGIFALLKEHWEEGSRAFRDALSKVSIAMMVEELRDRMPELQALPRE